MNFEESGKPVSINNGSDVGILIIHGFTSTVSSMKYMIEGFNKAQYNIEAPRLSGHGSRWENLNKVKYTDWILDAENALLKLKNISKKVFVFGLSMGGTISLYLAENHKDLSGLILVNNALIFKDPRLHLLPLLKLLIRATPAIGGDIKDPNETEIAYDKNPTNGLNELMKLIKIVKKNIKSVEIPTLIFKSKEDHVTPIESAVWTYEHISSKNKKFEWLTNSYHVATLDYDKDLIIKKSIDFINEN
ncbi:MAG TPA: alpha/beta fold hydrolase [Spirochaetota bacterium]|jgi:carboxylesterase|nr:MAG: Thermostable monoacylglycerol lipase [Spirochaetes bacterium ADurb.Bin133]HNZ27351.1 alpha/beta fold hydrolase [Spirochaetota bacterium]HOF00034.1 alpha/beta fold hydrolase [Spirochaetota bacterium]HOS32011.1 alpha/beta fold hydrolase [Spirochaetota bacterium]HOS54995.1 alpha/beta fold hydrolase [Spirochaetota bacterium]